MKNLLLLLILIAFFNLIAIGQKNKDVPANVKTAFSKEFPEASKVKWSKESDKEWEAEFNIDGKEYSAIFDNSGAWMETEYESSLSEIPAVVKSSLDKDFVGFQIKECEISVTREGKIFEFELKKGNEKTEVSIDANGNILSKELNKEENKMKDN